MQSVGQKQNLYISAVSFSLIVSAFAYVGLRREPRPFLPASQMPPVPKAAPKAAAPYAQSIPKLHRRIADAPWKAELPNGVRVEVVAANDTPGEQGKWWTPSGKRMPMPKRLYFLTPPKPPIPHPSRPDYVPVSCELAVRVRVPAGKSYEVRSETGVGYSVSHSASPLLFEPLPGGWVPVVLRYERGQPTTPLRVGVSVDKGEMQWVLFDNIALPPHDDDEEVAKRRAAQEEERTRPTGFFSGPSQEDSGAQPIRFRPQPPENSLLR